MSAKTIIRSSAANPSLQATKPRAAHPYLRVAPWLLLGGLAVYVHFSGLALVEWKNDEVGYRNAGLAYLRDDFSLNTEHPFLVKYLYGVAQHLYGGGSPVAVRAVSATAAILTTFVVAGLVHRVSGKWAALLAGTLWVLLPHPVQLGVRADTIAPKLERVASLDAVMVLMVALAQFFVWRWMQQQRWRYAVLAGAAFGLAGGSKAAALFAVPAVVLVAGWVAVRDGRSRTALVHGCAAALAASGALLATYLPDIAATPTHIRTIVDTASEQASSGHAVIIAGELYETAPWWSLAYWQWAGQGTVVTTILVVLAGLSLFRARLPRRLIALMLLSVAVPFVWLSVFNGFLLAHYASIYQPPLAILSALVLADLVRGRASERILGAVLGMLLLTSAAVATVGYVARLESAGYAPLNDAGSRLPPGSDVAVSGNPFSLAAYFPRATVTGAPERKTEYEAVVVDKRQALDPAVAALLAGRNWVLEVDTASVRLYLRRD
jgi:hypothetical protein